MSLEGRNCLAMYPLPETPRQTPLKPSSLYRAKVCPYLLATLPDPPANHLSEIRQWLLDVLFLVFLVFDLQLNTDLETFLS